MEFLLSDGFVRVFFTLAPFIVSGIVFFGYYKNKFSAPLVWLITAVLLGYASLFLWDRYSSGHIEEHAASSTVYIIMGALHGIVSLWVIAQTCAFFVYAARSYKVGENYFAAHRYLSLSTVALWFISFVTGVLLMAGVV